MGSRSLINVKGTTMNSRKLLIAAMLAAFAVPVFAQTATPRLDKREARQQERINKGVANGSLTQKEAAQLQKREDRLNRHEAKAKADGKVTPQERRRLEREANHVDRDIARKTHNKRTAP
jgi:hypothetical protein